MARKLKDKCIYGHDMSITRRRHKNGAAYCLECHKESFKRNYKPKIRIKKEPIILSKKEKQTKNRTMLLKGKYGMTNNDYNQMFVNQNGRCAICNFDLNNLYRAASIDHDHETGKVRGLLCNNCNWALGLFKDNCEFLQNAIFYLSNNK